jgi:hypothetical protein
LNSSATPPGPGGNADIPLESAAERSLRLIADFGSSLRDAHPLRIEKASRDLHTPSSQILHRRNLNVGGELLGEYRPRQADFARETIECPRVGGPTVNKAKSYVPDAAKKASRRREHVQMPERWRR